MSIKSLIGRLLAVAAVLGALAFGFTPAANAAMAPAAKAPTASVQQAVPAFGGGPKIDGGPSDSSSVCGSGSNPSGASQSELLPVTRWRDATGKMHHKLDNVMFADQGNIASRDTLTGTPISWGNTLWDVATNASAFSVAFCPLDTVGGIADQAAASIGNAFKNSALLTGMIALVVVFVLWRGRRTGAFPIKTLLAKVLIVGLLVGMTLGATNSTGGQGTTADYKPGVMSPGWVISSINSVVSSLASAPASALAANSATGLQTPKDKVDSTTNALSCVNYINTLRDRYANLYGGGSTRLSAGIPQVLSSMWESTGLTTWRMAQFGTATYDGASVDAGAWCHLLDWNSPNVQLSDPGTDQSDLSATVLGVMDHVTHNSPNLNVSSKAFSPTTNDDQDRSLIAWAACQLKPGADPKSEGSWTVSSVFSDGDSQGKATPSACKDWFTSSSSTLDAFDWSASADSVKTRTSPGTSAWPTTGGSVVDGGYTPPTETVVDGTPSASNQALRQFIETLHGNDTSGGVTAAMAYLIAALLMLIAFGMIALGVILAKIALVVMIFMVMVLLIMSLAPNANFEKVLGFLKTVLGISVYVFGIQLLFAIITVITNLLQEAGKGLLGGAGSIFSIFWTGLSPVIAVVLISFLFTKVLKVPHPFKVSSALAWGSKASEAGGSVLSGFQGLADWGHGKTAGAAKKGMGAASAGAKNGLNTMLSKATGGKLGNTRRGAASPVDPEKSGKAGAAQTASAAVKPRNGGEFFKSARDKAAMAAAIGAPGAAPGQGSLRQVAEKAGQDPMMFASSGVANSQLTKGLRGSERKLVEPARKKELEDAKAFVARRRAELAVPEEELTKGQRHFKQVMDHKEAHKNKYKAAAVAVGTGAALVAAGPVGAVAVAGFAVGKTLYNNRPAARRAQNDADVNTYRAANLERKALEEKKAKEDAAARKQNIGAESSGRGSAPQGGAPAPGSSTAEPQQGSRMATRAAHSQMNDNAADAPLGNGSAPRPRAR